MLPLLFASFASFLLSANSSNHEALANDKDPIKGVWRGEIVGGDPSDAEKVTMIFDGNYATRFLDGYPDLCQVFSYQLALEKIPTEIDLKDGPFWKPILGIFKREGKRLTLRFDEGSDKRPNSFNTNSKDAVLIRLSWVKPLPNPNDPARRAEITKLQGKWQVISPKRPVDLPPTVFTFKGNQLTWLEYPCAHGPTPCTFQVFPDERPKRINITSPSLECSIYRLRTFAIYEISGDELTLCWEEPTRPELRKKEEVVTYPKDFKLRRETITRVKLRRIKP
jgi:uncharacterized protein (TIGR03067 family)